MPAHGNVETVTRIYEELNAGRVFPPELFAADCVTDWTDVAPDGDELRGVAATQRALSQYFDTFDEFHVAAEVLRAGDHTVLTAIRDGGRMKGSPAEIWNDYFHAWTLRDGKVVRLSSHLDRQNALAAAESQENVEIVRAYYATLPALGELDPGGEGAFVDRVFRDYLDEDFELGLPAGYPEGQPSFRGREGVREMAAMLREAWSEWRFEPERFLAAGDKVVVLVRVTAAGSGSGVPIELPDGHLVTLRDGRLVSVRVYRDRAEALRAAGIEERV